MNRYEVNVSNTGVTRWKLNGCLHRENGPAVEGQNGYKAWYLNGQSLTEDEFNATKNTQSKPDKDGITYEVRVSHLGSEAWYLNDKFHRENGPAIVCADGSKLWYINGKLHRTDGPASEYSNGNKYWWVDGKQLTESEFNARLNPPKEIDVNGVIYVRK